MQIDRIETPDESVRKALFRLIDDYNDAASGLPEPARHLGIHLHNAAGIMVGGLRAYGYYGWLHVDDLFLPADRRGHGLGRRIMRHAEAMAAAHGYRGIWLTTFHEAARAFYQRLGYRVFGRLDYPGGVTRYWLMKTDPRPDPGPADGLAITAQPTAAADAMLDRGNSALIDVLLGANDRNPFGLLLRAPDGAITGGLWARPFWGWLFVDYLILPEASRHAGLGSRLLAEAEQAARARGQIGVFLDTFSFQARPFYQRHGYRVFAEIADYPAGGARYFLAKPLDGSGMLAENGP